MSGVYVGRRDVVLVAGADAAGYLQGQISQDVDDLPVGESVWSLVLQPQGKVDALFRLTRSAPDRFILDVDEGFGETLLGRLRRFLLRMDVDLEPATWEFHAYRGERPDGIVAPIVGPVEWSDAPGLDAVGPDLGEPVGDLPRLSAAGFERLRIEAGVPAMGSELDGTTIPAEAGDVHQWVSFTKGCYTGQELVARIDSRGSNTPRSLRKMSGRSPVPEPGSPLIVAGSEAGVLTSVATTETGWVALGYVKRGTDTQAAATVGADVAVLVEDVGGGS